MDYYEILSCPKDATYEELKLAYHELVLKLHPDKLSSSVSKESEKFLKVIEAWKTLGTPEKREEYDMTLKQAIYDKELLVYDTVKMHEMTYNVNQRSYSFPCRCGGIYEFSKREIVGHLVYKDCNECSFKICVIND